MPKRPYPEDDFVQPIKKQQTAKTKSRKIRSSSSERTLQLLYQGAAKHNNTSENEKQFKSACSQCAKLTVPTISCSYCEKDVCLECKNLCYRCQNEFCYNCSFLTYDQNEAVCYSCCG